MINRSWRLLSVFVALPVLMGLGAANHAANSFPDAAQLAAVAPGAGPPGVAASLDGPQSQWGDDIWQDFGFNRESALSRYERAPKLDLTSTADDGVSPVLGMPSLRESPAMSLTDLVDATRTKVPQRLSEDMQCLATAIYFEARGEPVAGQLGVAQVILNRASDSRYPQTVCDVVFQGSARRTGCQFSFTCDSRADTPRDQQAWARARAVAVIAASGAWKDVTGAATHFHTVHVSPRWSRTLTSTAQLGRHIFYR